MAIYSVATVNSQSLLGDIVDSGIRLPGYIDWQAGTTTICQQPESTISPSKGLRIWLPVLK